jgi:hypothetical protein
VLVNTNHCNTKVLEGAITIFIYYEYDTLEDEGEQQVLGVVYKQVRWRSTRVGVLCDECYCSLKSFSSRSTCMCTIPNLAI